MRLRWFWVGFGILWFSLCLSVGWLLWVLLFVLLLLFVCVCCFLVVCCSSWCLLLGVLCMAGFLVNLCVTVGYSVDFGFVSIARCLCGG